MAQTLEAMFYQGNEQGPKVDHTPGSALSPGEVVLLAGFCGIANDPNGIAAAQLGSLHTAGVWKIKKAVSGGVTFSQGDPVRWDDTGKTAVTSGNGDQDLGIAFEDAADADDHVKVHLNTQVMPDNS